MRRSIVVLTAALLASGLAIACELFTHSFNVDVSNEDIARAAAQGHPNPSRAAAAANLDALGEAEFGAQYWRTNNFLGPVRYRFENGMNLVTEDKPCGKTFQEALPPKGVSGFGSIGRFSWYGGRVWASGSCIYGCGTGTTSVGEVKPY